ncbi:MAG: LacI family DNA-binding transcriptional regulator [Clostridiales bacterium]|nr:LacI family DNA-binding transcriptional regulator [Clostridiales bacterium]
MSSTRDRKKNRVTIKDVATAADVSIATVSYVLNNTPGQSISEDTRKKVLQFANLLGYECNVMAKYLASGKSNTISVILKDAKPFAAHYYLKLLTELSRLLWRQNFGLKIVDYSDGFKRNTDCDAYITIALSEKEFREFADTKYIPVIAIDSAFDDFLFYRINDDYESLYKTAKSESGLDKIGLLTFDLPEEVIQSASAVFDEVKIVNSLSDLNALDSKTCYVTLSGAIHDIAPKSLNIRLQSSSFALKASAAADAVIKALNRLQAPSGEHHIKV